MEFVDKEEATEEEIEKNETGRDLLEYGDIITEKHLAGLEEWKRNGLSLQEVVDLVNALGPIKPWNSTDKRYSSYFFMPMDHKEVRKMVQSDFRLGVLMTKLQEHGKFTKEPEDLDWIRLATFLQEVIFDARTELERVGVVDKEGKINPKATVQPPNGVTRVDLKRN